MIHAPHTSETLSFTLHCLILHALYSSQLCFQHTHYVAEFFNTLSSVPICLVGLYSFRMALTHQYGFNFLCASLGLFVVGVGSVVFHGTLLRQGQVLDEVPMIWSSSLFLWIGLSLR